MSPFREIDGVWQHYAGFEGGPCVICEAEPATVHFGWDNHGGGEWRCERCVLTAQLTYVRERAAAIPDLEAKLAALPPKP